MRKSMIVLAVTCILLFMAAGQAQAKEAYDSDVKRGDSGFSMRLD